MDRLRALSRIVLMAALAVHAVVALAVIAMRIRYPHDLEWMTGSVLDHIERVREGKPVYAAPSAGWIPFLYPPLFYWLSAALGGGAFVTRMISLLASIAQAFLAWRAARLLSATKFWATAAALVFVAAFSYVGFWYDIERSDNLFGALALTGAVVLLRARGVRGHVVAGLLLSLATLAKQQAVFYVAGAGVGLLLATRASDEPARRRDVIAFGAAAMLPILVLLGLTGSGGGWAAYYLIRMPRAHGVMMSLAPDVFARDVPSGFLLFGVTFAAAIGVALQSLRRKLLRRDAIGGAILAAGFAGAVASRLHIGGWINVLVPWTAFAAIAVGVVASRLEEQGKKWPWTGPVLCAVVVVQLVVWSYDPRRVLPAPGSAADEERLRAEIESLEREGEVLLPARGHLTKVRHFHISALADAARVEGHSPPDLVAALRDRSFAAVVDDARYYDFHTTDWPPILLEDLEDLRTPLLSSYFVARRIDYGSRPLALPSPANPAWVYRPRRTRLDVAPAELRRRQLAEMHLAEARALALGRGLPAPFAEAEIEELAAKAEPNGSKSP